MLVYLGQSTVYELNVLPLPFPRTVHFTQCDTFVASSGNVLTQICHAISTLQVPQVLRSKYAGFHMVYL